MDRSTEVKQCLVVDSDCSIDAFCPEDSSYPNRNLFGSYFDVLLEDTEFSACTDALVR